MSDQNRTFLKRQLHTQSQLLKTGMDVEKVIVICGPRDGKSMLHGRDSADALLDFHCRAC
jgi:hypothetical protein